MDRGIRRCSRAIEVWIGLEQRIEQASVRSMQEQLGHVHARLYNLERVCDRSDFLSVF